MARPKTLTLNLVVDADGICASQTPAGGGAQALTINGVLTSGGAYSSTTAQQIGIACAGDETARTFTVVGKGYDSSSRYHDSISEAISGVNASTAESTYYFTEISSITVDNNTAGAITVGPVDEAITQIFPVNWRRREDIGVQTAVSGTVNYDVDLTCSDVQNSSATLDWTTVSTDLAAATAGADATVDGGIRALRMQINSGNTGAVVRLHIVES